MSEEVHIDDAIHLAALWPDGAEANGFLRELRRQTAAAGITVIQLIRWLIAHNAEVMMFFTDIVSGNWAKLIQDIVDAIKKNLPLPPPAPPTPIGP